MSFTLDLISDRILKSANPDKIILFGSRAKGSNTVDSDWDICVIKSDLRSKRETIKSLYLATADLGLAIDFLAYSVEEFNSDFTPNSVLSDIVNQGIVVYDKP